MPGKDDNEVWHNTCRNRLKVSMGVQYERMDILDALWYGAVTPGEALENPDRKQQELGRLIEKNRADLTALHPEAGALLEKLTGNQAELRDYEAWLVFHSGFRLGMQLAAEALTNRPKLYLHPPGLQLQGQLRPGHRRHSARYGIDFRINRHSRFP